MAREIWKITLLSLLGFWLICLLVLPRVCSGTDIVWSADHETADLSQWMQKAYGFSGESAGGSFDSGDCIRPPGGVTTEYSRSGRYAIKMSMGSGGGCRQFRQAESKSGNSFYYSAWLLYHVPYAVRSWTNVVQFKSRTPSQNDAVWVLELDNRQGGAMYLKLRWKGLMEGPRAGEGTGLKTYSQALKDVPAAKWFHVEVYLRQSSGYTGRITVWQDGVQIYDMDNVKTKYPDGDNRWSINAYGDDTSPMPFTVYVDDAVVSTSRIGSNGGAPLNPPTGLRVVKP